MNRNVLTSSIAAASISVFLAAASSCGGSSTKQAETPATSSAPPETAATTPKISSDDKSFMASVAKDGYAEIQLANLALKKAHSPAVREFAQKVVDDHQKIDADLAKLAAKKSVTLPDSASMASSFSEGHLKMLSGTHFDQAYLSKMIDNHKDAISTFQKEAAQGADTDVKDFASTTVSTLQKHLDEAQELENKTNVHKGAKS
jgi:putative membrane protein